MSLLARWLFFWLMELMTLENMSLLPEEPAYCEACW